MLWTRKSRFFRILGSSVKNGIVDIRTKSSRSNSSKSISISLKIMLPIIYGDQASLVNSLIYANGMSSQPLRLLLITSKRSFHSFLPCVINICEQALGLTQEVARI
jgi:hypothetical protein